MHLLFYTTVHAKQIQTLYKRTAPLDSTAMQIQVYNALHPPPGDNYLWPNSGTHRGGRRLHTQQRPQQRAGLRGAGGEQRREAEEGGEGSALPDAS